MAKVDSGGNIVADIEPECTPESLFKIGLGCFGFLLSLIVSVALAMTAAGTFWVAQSLEDLAANQAAVRVHMLTA